MAFKQDKANKIWDIFQSNSDIPSNNENLADSSNNCSLIQDSHKTPCKELVDPVSKAASSAEKQGTQEGGAGEKDRFGERRTRRILAIFQYLGGVLRDKVGPTAEN